MLIHCDQCHSKYKITIKKIPSKPVNFRCGKCQKMILITPEELQKELGPAPAPPAETKASAPEPPAPEAAPVAPEPAEGSQTDTVQLTCLKCGIAFVKHKDDKARLCYQCRIDQIVTKIKDKYGVTQDVELPEAKSKYTFRSPDGLILGPIKLKTVAVLVREKRLQGQEEVAKDGAEFRPLSEFAELKSLFPELQPAEPAPAPAAATVEDSNSRYRFRSPEGSVLGPMKLKIAAAFARERKLKGNEEVSKDGADFHPLTEFEELRPLFPELPAPPAAPQPAAEHEEEISLDLDETPPQPAAHPQVEAPAPPKAEAAKTPPNIAAPPAPPEPALGTRVPPPEPALGARVTSPASEAPPPPASPAPAAAAENVSRYKIRYPDGLVLGPIRLLAVEDLVAAGNLTGQEEVQKDTGGWKPFLDYPELKRLLASGEEIAEDEIVELTDLLEEAS